MSLKNDSRPGDVQGSGTADPDLVKTLRVREAQLNAIIAASPVPKFVIDKNHRVISWNRALENATGLKAAEVLGTNHHWRAFYSEGRPCLADLIVDGSTGKIPALYPHSYQRADLVPGAYEVTDFFPSLGCHGKWLHIIAAPLMDDNGTMIGAVETLEDISTFIGIQKELQESEERYSALFSNNASVSLLIDPDTGRIVDANAAAVRYYGYPKEQLTARGIFDLNRLPEEKVVNNLIRAKQEKAKHFQSVHYRAGGEKRFVEVYSGPITVQGKALFYSIIHDITDRKLAEEQLRESENKFSTIFQNSPVVLTLVSGTDGKISDVNDAFVRKSGYLRKEVLGKTSAELGIFADPDDPGRIQSALQKSQCMYGMEIKIRTKSGDIRTCQFSACLILMGKNPAILATIEDITDRKKAEQELKESEERYSALFSNNYSVSLIIDPDTGKIVNANDAAVRYYGYPRDRLLSMGIYDLNRLPQKKVVSDLVRAKQEKAKHFQSVHYRADGDKRFVEVYSGPITVQGKALFYSIIHDITDRKTAEAELRKNQYLLSEAMDMAQMADWEFDAVSATFIFNDRFYSLYATTAEREGGYRMPAEVYLREFTHPDDQQIVTDEIAKALSLPGSGYRALREHRIIRRDGEIRYIIVRIRVTRDASGRTIGTHGANQDITERKMTENALRESEERYRTLIDQLPDYVIVHRDGILLYVNPAGAATLSCDAKAIIGKSILNLIAPESHEIVRKAAHLRMLGEEVQPYEIRVAARDGTYHTVLVHGALIQYDGAPASINVLTDITPLKEAEDAIRNANEDLEKRVLERTEDLRQANVQLTAEVAARAQAEQEISRSLEEKVLLLREIHHRVKNNLQIITSLLKLQSRFITDQGVLEAIRDTQSRVRTMSLVHERIYRSPDIAEINVKDYLLFLVKQVAQFYNVQQHRIALSVTMPEIMADIDMVTPLGLIMNELVSNSLKHAFADNRKGSISIEGTLQGTDRLRFVYQDNGVGMPEGFDWKATESLGLRLVNNLVDQLDGTIAYGGGEGTRFIIEIPLKNAQKTAERASPENNNPDEDLPDEPGTTGAFP